MVIDGRRAKGLRAMHTYLEEETKLTVTDTGRRMLVPMIHPTLITEIQIMA